MIRDFIRTFRVYVLGHTVRVIVILWYKINLISIFAYNIISQGKYQVLVHLGTDADAMVVITLGFIINSVFQYEIHGEK